MKYFLLISLLTITTLTACSQASDFLSLKKSNNRTIKTYFPGIPITLQTIDNRWIGGIIADIRNDSVFVQAYDIRRVGTIGEGSKMDTLTSYIVNVPFKEIKQVYFETRRKAFSFITDGTILMIGGLGYALLNIINGKYLHESITSSSNLKSLGIALGVAVTGFILNRIQRLKGKNYHLEYIHMNEVKKQLRGF